MTTATKTEEREITLLPGQANILANFEDKILAAVAGCVAGRTLIDTPIGRRPIKELLGFNDVLAMTNEGIGSVPAFIFCKGTAQLYRLTLANGDEVEATADHYLLVADGETLRWRSVGELMPTLTGQREVSVVSVEPPRGDAEQPVGCLPVLRESSSVFSRSGLPLGVHHCWDREPNYQGRCSGCPRLGAQQPLQVADSDPEPSPLLVGVHGHNHSLLQRGAQGISREYNRLCQYVVPHARSSLAPLPDHDSDGGCRVSPYNHGQSRGLAQELLPNHKLTYDSLLPTSLDGLFQPVSSSYAVPYLHLQSLLYHKLVEITSIVPTTIASYYDMVVPQYHNYLAEGMVHHNTGAGKTMTGYWWLHSRMTTYPGFTWGLAEPTYKMLDRIILNSSDPGRPTLEEYWRSVGHHPVFSKGEMIIRTDFGQIYLYTAENPNTMQGAPVKGFWLDEGGQMSLLAHETALQRCSMMEGQELITTTPYNLGWLLTEVVNKKGNGIAVEQWRSIDRPGFPLASYEYMRQRLPPWRFAMLYDAQFEKPAGLIYQAFNESVCVIDRFPIPPSWLVYVGHDFGADNPCALFYAQDPGTGNFFLFHEYLPGMGLSANEHVINLKKIIRLPGEEGKDNPKTYNVIKRVGGSKSGEDDSRQLYTAHGWVINEPKIGKVEPRIDKVIGLHQLNKIFCFRDMSHYLDEKRTFSRKLNENGEPTLDIENEARFHAISAEQYILSDFRPETIEQRQFSRVWKF